MSPRECSPRSVQRETCLAKFHSSSPIKGPMALLHPDIDSPPRYSRVRRPAGTFGRAFRSLKAARISPQNIGRIVCSRLTRSFPPLRLLFFIRASFFPPSLDFLHHLEKPWLELEREREKIHDNVFLFFSFLFFFFSSSEGSEWFTLCLLPRQWRKGETIVRKVNSLITSEIGIDGADYHGGQRDREVAPFVRSSPPFNTFSTAIRSPIRGCRCCNIQWAAVNNRFQCVHGNKPLPPSPFFFFFFFSIPDWRNGKNYPDPREEVLSKGLLSAADECIWVFTDRVDSRKTTKWSTFVAIARFLFGRGECSLVGYVRRKI